jgi:hypothetical protein
MCYVMCEELKMVMLINRDVELFLKQMIIDLLYKLIKNLCKMIKVVSIQTECDMCD